MQLVELKEFLQATESCRPHLEERRLDPAQPYRGAGDGARQTHAANRPGEPFRILIRRAHEDLAGCAGQLELLDEAPECAGAMMILAVDIVGDRPPDGHDGRTR